MRLATVEPGPIPADSGLKTVADEALPEEGPIGTLLVPGGIGVRHVCRDAPELVAWLRRAAARAERVVSVCTGAPTAIRSSPSGSPASCWCYVDIGMTAWMAWRRHAWPAIVEMSLVMYLSFVVLFPAYWLGVLSGAGVIIAEHVLMLPAMALAMPHRGEEYVHG